MRATRWAVSVSVLALGFLSAAEPTLAQQITGTPGSPEATTTINGQCSFYGVVLANQASRNGLSTSSAKSPVRTSMPITSPKTGIQLPVAS